jgi:hypothetical protein
VPPVCMNGIPMEVAPVPADFLKVPLLLKTVAPP